MTTNDTLTSGSILTPSSHFGNCVRGSYLRFRSHHSPGSSEGLLFNAFGAHLRRRFGGRIQRVSVDAGFTCPNVDGAVARGGCNFCDNRSFSPSRRVRLKQVREQLGIRHRNRQQAVRQGFRIHRLFSARHQHLRPGRSTGTKFFELALSTNDRIVGIAIGTRPDCVPESVLAMIGQLAEQTYVSLEFGMQTIHDDGLTVDESRPQSRGHDQRHRP